MIGNWVYFENNWGILMLHYSNDDTAELSCPRWSILDVILAYTRFINTYYP